MAERPTVLVIDDERPIRETLTAYLEDSDFRVIQAENGRVGIEQCSRHQPDVVLCDLRMPEMDGLEVLAAVKRQFPEMPIIVVSGIAQPTHARYDDDRHLWKLLLDGRQHLEAVHLRHT